MKNEYTAPVDLLLVYGDCRKVDKTVDGRAWPNYLELGFTDEHIPELIKMATDAELNLADQDDLEVWAPQHAWRALGQLKAEAAIEPLLALLEYDDDWARIEVPQVYGMIGAAAIPAVTAFSVDKSRGQWDRITACFALEQIGNNNPSARADCVKALEDQLALFDENTEFNGFLVNYLTDLKAIEALATIRAAFERKLVDISIQGDLEDTEIEIGVREKRSTPRPRYNFFPDLPLDDLFLSPSMPSIAPTTFVRPEPKIGRNDPCPCGSGKKYKKCCLN